MKNSTKLIISIILDLIGMISYSISFFGEISDILFSFIEAAWIKYAYKSTPLSAIGFAEELLPFTDIVPMNTISHIYDNRKNNKSMPSNS